MGISVSCSYGAPIRNCGHRYGLLEKSRNQQRDNNMRAQMHIAQQYGIDVYDISAMISELDESEFFDAIGHLKVSPKAFEFYNGIITTCNLRASVSFQRCVTRAVSELLLIPDDRDIPSGTLVINQSGDITLAKTDDGSIKPNGTDEPTMEKHDVRMCQEFPSSWMPPSLVATTSRSCSTT